MLTIESEQLSVSINTKGAELDSIYHKQHQLEYMWDGNPAVWAKKSPILFPIVGTLKNDTYYYKEKAYQLGRHGFARENEFVTGEHTDNSVSLSLKSNEATLQKYPFEFELVITYQVQDSSLGVSYKVINQDSKTMLFSIGGHPAFRVPLVEDTGYEDYYLEFEKKENATRCPISPEGLIESLPTPLLEDSNLLPLTRELFQNDAVVFKHLESNQVSLKSGKTSHGLTFGYAGFPYLGIWAAKNADFVCIEPWYGIADNVMANQNLSQKEGILKLEPAREFESGWSLQLF